MITALGKTWHPEHFTCTHCNQELGTRNFFEREGHPYCEPDYHNLFSPRCAYCNGPILDVRRSFNETLRALCFDRYSRVSYRVIFRNVLPLWRKLGIRSTSFAPSVANNSVKRDFTSGTGSRTAERITSTCSLRNAVDVIVPSWRIIYRRWTVNGIQTVSFAG